MRTNAMIGEDSPAQGQDHPSEDGAGFPPEGESGDRQTGHRSALTRRPLLVVAVLAVFAGGWAGLASAKLFPYLSLNQDEAVYLLQAETLRHGRLFPPAPPAEGDALLPWLSAQVGDHYVPKYSPVWPAVIAVARLLTGTDHMAQAVVAAAVVLMTYLLAREVLGRRWPAVLASLFFVLSPFFLIQSATFLSYLFNVVLLEGFAVALLRGSRRRSRWLLAGSGVLLGLAFFARPFDALLFALPFGLWLIITKRHSPRALAWHAGWVTAGLVPPLAAMLSFFRAATGSALRSPFNLLDKSDMLGFGQRRVFPWDPKVEFGAKEAWHGLATHSVLMSFWCFGGLVLIALAIVALRRRRTGLEGWLGLVALSVPLGYLLFWGSELMTRWQGPWSIGPFYYLPVLVPLAVLGAGGFARLVRFDRRLAGLALAGMVIVSGLVVGRALDSQGDVTRGERALHAPLEEAGLQRAVVFLPRYAPQLMMPFVKARNPSLDQNVVWALDRGDEANSRVLDVFPGRKPYRLTEGAPGVLHELVRRRATTVTALVQVRPPADAGSLQLAIGRGARLETYHLNLPAGAGPFRLQLTMEGDTLNVLGPVDNPRVSARNPVPDEPEVLLWLMGAPPGGGSAEELGASGFDIRKEGDELELLLPATESPEGPDAPALEVIAGPPG